MKRLKFCVPLLLAAAVALAAGCQALNQVTKAGTDILVASGTISSNQAHAITTSTAAFGKALEQVTPEQEYYLGRTVGATVLQKYDPYDRAAVNDYLNLLGQTLASASDRPETYAGYHFLALDSESINAFAAPGGFIFVTRGMLGLCQREDDLAAVLSHEIGHVELKHGLKAISQDRWVSASLVTGVELLKQNNPDLGQLTDAFSGVIDGVSDVLLVKGYGRRLELQADRAAVKILTRVGYDPEALVDILHALEKNTEPGHGDYGQTHPNPEKRVASVRKAIKPGRKVAEPTEARTRRFAKFARALK